MFTFVTWCVYVPYRFFYILANNLTPPSYHYNKTLSQVPRRCFRIDALLGDASEAVDTRAHTVSPQEFRSTFNPPADAADFDVSSKAS